MKKVQKKKRRVGALTKQERISRKARLERERLAKDYPNSVFAIGDEKFVPTAGEPTDVPAGTEERIEVMRRRVELGEELFNENDRVTCHGIDGRRYKLGDTENAIWAHVRANGGY